MDTLSNNFILWAGLFLGSAFFINSQMTKKDIKDLGRNNYVEQSNKMPKQSNTIVKHYVIDIDYLNDIACNIAENVPAEFYDKFLKELKEYMKCAINDAYSSSEESLENESDCSDLDEEVYEVETDENGFYSIAECDVKDCNAVGKEEKIST